MMVAGTTWPQRIPPALPVRRLLRKKHGGKIKHVYESNTTDAASSLAGARAALPANSESSSAHAFRRGPRARRALLTRSCRYLPGLLEEPHHRRDTSTSSQTSRIFWLALPYQTPVPTRK